MAHMLLYYIIYLFLLVYAIAGSTGVEESEVFYILCLYLGWGGGVGLTVHSLHFYMSCYAAARLCQMGHGGGVGSSNNVMVRSPIFFFLTYL